MHETTPILLFHIKIKTVKIFFAIKKGKLSSYLFLFIFYFIS